MININNTQKSKLKFTYKNILLVEVTCTEITIIKTLNYYLMLI